MIQVAHLRLRVRWGFFCSFVAPSSSALSLSSTAISSSLKARLAGSQLGAVRACTSCMVVTAALAAMAVSLMSRSAVLKIVSGYPGGNDVVLAMERGELQSRCGWSWSSVKATHGSWIAEKKLNVLVQLALHKHPDLPDVPLIPDLATTDQQRQVLRLIF